MTLSRCFRLPSLAVVLFALMSCTTPYQESGFTGGVTSLQLSENTFRIVASGNGFTSATTLDGYTLRKASEIALAAGYDSFYFINESIEQKNSSTTTNGSSNTYGNVDSSGNLNATTNYTPPTTTQITKYAISKDVYLINRADVTGTSLNIYDAAIINSNFQAP